MIVDANPIVSACLGHSKPLFQHMLGGGAELYVPEQQMREARLVTFREGPRLGLEPGEAFAWAPEALLVVPEIAYLTYEHEARARLGSAGGKDWPLVALALASGDDIWSNDVDLFGIGLPVWNTHNIRRMTQPAVTADTGQNGSHNA